MTDENQDQERREQKRDIALYNLRSQGLSDLATAYFAQREGSGFGKIDNDSVEQFLYRPGFNAAVSGGLNYRNPETGEEVPLAGVSAEEIERSREEGRRYSGRVEVSEYRTIQKASEITEGSLINIKVKDVRELIGSDVNIKEGYEDKYLSELLESDDEKDRAFAQLLIGGYQGHVTMKGVSSAISQSADLAKGGLEKVLSGEELPRAA